MKTIIRLLLFLAVWQVSAQEKAKQPLSWKNVANWKAIPNFGGVQISPDGQWMYYVLSVDEGDNDLIIRKTSDTTQYTYQVGAGMPMPRFSEDSKWIAFKVSPKSKDKKAASKSGKPLPDKLFLVELSKNKKTEYEKVKNFAFNGEKATHLAIHLSSEKTDTKGSDLLLVDLANMKALNMGNISEMAFNKAGNWLALTIDAAEKAGNGIHLRNMLTGTTMIMDNEKASYKSLNWTEAGDGLALLRGMKDEKLKSEPHAVLGIKKFDTMPELTVYDPKKDSINFPKKMVVSANRTPFWTEDLSRLMFGFAKQESVKKEDKKPETKKDTTKKLSDADLLAKIKSDTTIKSIADLQKALAKSKADSSKTEPKKEESEKPEVTIWHWQDKRLQSRQQVLEMQDKNYTFLGMYDAASSKFTRLTDSSLRNITPLKKHLFAFGQDNSAYELDANLDGQQYNDIYVVDLKTGNRTRILEKLHQSGFGGGINGSPDGTKVLYFKEGHFYVYDLLSKTHKNITEKAPTSFINTEEDRNLKTPPTNVIGWTNDSKYVLINDLWDVWKISVDGKETINLSQNGAKDKIRYQVRYRLDEEEKGIDLKQSQYFGIYGETTKKSGFARLDEGKKMTTVLWEDAAIGSLMKAKKSNTFLYSKETFTDPSDYFVTSNTTLSDGKQLTKNAPEFEKYAWSGGVQLVNYTSDKGDALQGALFLPAGYEKGKKYPTVVYYYEKLSQTLHNFSNPSYSRTGWSPSMYTSNGYAVFIPDIVYKLNDPGMSAAWCVIPAVKEAIKTGVIDETKIGIHGHSWGGYQTCFLITQTNMFKAAAAGAPLTNMISMYDLIYWNTGGANMAIFEASQGRLTTGPWDNWDAYLRNSPIYNIKKVETPLLMLHNNKDGAVDFTQGIEFYNALRRLKKPVVMIQYKDENHGLAKYANRRDYSVRMMEFFDYHLKGKPAPEWLKSGVERLQLEDHLESRTMGEE